MHSRGDSIVRSLTLSCYCINQHYKQYPVLSGAYTSSEGLVSPFLRLWISRTWLSHIYNVTSHTLSLLVCCLGLLWTQSRSKLVTWPQFCNNAILCTSVEQKVCRHSKIRGSLYNSEHTLQKVCRHGHTNRIFVQFQAHPAAKFAGVPECSYYSVSQVLANLDYSYSVIRC